MQVRLRAAVLEVLARKQRDHVKIGENGGDLGGVMTEGGIRTFVKIFRSTRWAPSPPGSATPRLSGGGEDTSSYRRSAISTVSCSG